jgi:predicted small secreted protein
MKNTIKLIGIIVLVAVVGFSMAACSSGGGGGDDKGGSGLTAKLTVTNNYTQPITKVKVENFADTNFEDTTGIPAGSSKTFTIPMKKKEDYGWWGLTLYASGLTGDNDFSATSLWIESGKTSTATLNSDGTITKTP